VADMDCLPDALVSARFYHPTDRGWERRIKERLSEIEQSRKNPRRGGSG
jgi:replication-associated recombination protein RarA